ncbi:SDR family NAD(P)-dependent oxidoreductase [Pedobacter chinensis]|nr:SDR family NAD(P)-dependent oxidoreductase [Pedobacter chinensis]
MIIITGASRGIGKYLLHYFVNRGEENVIGICNNTIPDSNLAHYYKLNLKNDTEIKNFIAQNDGINQLTLINAAGISYNAFAHKADLESWIEVIETNLIGLFNLTRHLLPIMRSNNYGRIINFSSVVAQQGVAGTSAYAASKAALWGLTKTLAAENASKNITVNNINLGYFNIGMIDQVPESILTQIIAQVPAKRLGDPTEILSTIKYMIETPYLNGASIDLNGGLF